MSSVSNVVWRITDADNAPVPLGQLQIEAAGTTTLSNVYADAGLSVAASNPLIADSEGYPAQFFLANGDYKFTLKDADGATLKVFDNVRVQAYDLDTVLTDEEGSVQPYHFGFQDQNTILTNPNAYSDLPQWATAQQFAGAFEGVTFPAIDFNGQISFTFSGANIRMKDPDFGEYWGKIFVDDGGHLQITAAVDTKEGYNTTALFIGRDEDPTDPQTVMTLEQAQKVFVELSDTLEVSSGGITLKMFDTDYSDVHFAAIYPDDVGHLQFRTAEDQSLGNTLSGLLEPRGTTTTSAQTLMTREKSDNRYIQNDATSITITGSGVTLEMFDTDYSSTYPALMYPDDLGRIQFRTAVDNALGNLTTAFLEERGATASSDQTIITREKGDNRYSLVNVASDVSDATNSTDVVTRFNELLTRLRSLQIIG